MKAVSLKLKIKKVLSWIQEKFGHSEKEGGRYNGKTLFVRLLANNLRNIFRGEEISKANGRCFLREEEAETVRKCGILSHVLFIEEEMLKISTVVYIVWFCYINQN